MAFPETERQQICGFDYLGPGLYSELLWGNCIWELGYSPLVLREISQQFSISCSLQLLDMSKKNANRNSEGCPAEPWQGGAGEALPFDFLIFFSPFLTANPAPFFPDKGAQDFVFAISLSVP